MNTIEINKSIWIDKDTIPKNLIGKCGYETKNKIDIYPLLKEYTVFDVIQNDDNIRLFANRITFDELIILKVIFDADDIAINNWTFCEDGVPVESIEIKIT